MKGCLSIKGRNKRIDNVVTDAFIGFLKEREARSPAPNVIHATELYGFCPRRWKIALEEGLSARREAKRVFPSLSLTYHLGEAIEELFGRALNKQLDLIGIWKCPVCGATRKGIKKPCHKCSYPEPLYTQIEFKYEVGPFRIIGHPDFLITDDKGAYIVECKSMGESKYNTLWNYGMMRKPLVEHLYQVHAYLYIGSKAWGRKRAGWRTGHVLSTTTAVIAYIPKAHNPTPIKAFTVNKTKYIWKELKEGIEALGSKGLPPRKCSNSLSYLAVNYCPKPIRKRCFELEE